MEAERKRISSVIGPCWETVSGDLGRGNRGHAYGDDVAPDCPLRPEFLHGRKAEPLGPAALDDEVAEQRAGEQERGEGQRAERVPQRGRPQAQEVQRVTRGGGAGAGAGEHHVGEARAGEA